MFLYLRSCGLREDMVHLSLGFRGFLFHHGGASDSASVCSLVFSGPGSGAMIPMTDETLDLER